MYPGLYDRPKLAAYRSYAPKPELQWCAPPPTFDKTTFHVDTNWPPFSVKALREAYTIDYEKVELHLALAVPMNEPHHCTHEGPWTLHSCETCDIREAKLITGLFAWLLDDKTALDQVRPQPYVACMHPGATVYEQCKTCRELHYKFGLNERDSMFAKYNKYKRYRQQAKQASFAMALGPYGGVR